MKRIPARLSFAVVGSGDVQALQAFYERLGWEPAVSVGGEFAAFHLGGAVFAIWDANAMTAESGAGRGPGGFNLAVNVDERDDVDAALALAEAAGATVRPAEDKDFGGRSGNFADPEGNVWEVAWNPQIRFDGRGAVVAFDTDPPSPGDEKE